MRKIFKLLKKYKISIIIALAIITVGFILIFLLVNNKISIKTFENNYYIFKYDEKWRMANKSNLTVKLKNNNKASLSIELVKLDDEYKYSNISNIIDDFLYSIYDQNKEYNLISNKEAKVTKDNLNGYKLLYENDSSQVMIVIVKSNDKIIIFNYEADNKYFDILLDSVQNIIYNFKIKSDTFKLNYKISVDTNDISYSENKDLVSKLSVMRNYDIASQNYYVNYSLPSIFKLKNMDSKMGVFEYDENGNKISITTNVFNFNIYDYIDISKEYGNIYSDFSYIKKDPDKYKNFTDGISEYKIGNYSGYVYKISYTYNKSDIENYIIAVALNKNHIFLLKIEGKNIKIPKELLDSIKINSVKNYSSYITRNIVDGCINVKLKRFSNIDYTEYDLINIKLPEKYIENDKGSNIYSDRHFGLNYDPNNDVYQYNLKYTLTSTYTSIESQINLANSSMLAYKSYGNINELSSSGNITLNGKQFLIYEGSYTKKGLLYNSSEDNELYVVYEKLLLYELDNGGYIAIIIDGNNIEVDNEILNEISNFEVKKEIYK